MSESNTKNSWVMMALFLMVGLFLGIKISSYWEKRDSSSSGGEKMKEILHIIKQNYVDTVNTVQMEDAGLQALLQSLDPHSVYIPAKNFQEAEEEIEGNFEGIGVQFRMMKDTVVIIMPVSGGPSEKVGVQPGDRIIKVDTGIIAGKKLSTEAIMKRLKGPKGSKVRLGLKRANSSSLVYVTVERGVIPTYSVDVHFMATPQLGYIKVSKFTRTTGEEFIQAMSDLKGKGMKRLLLDLRSNGGGLLGSCVEMADMFLDKGDMIVYTQGEHRKRAEVKASGRGLYKQLPMVVLVDEWAASASEIFAGAMQDNDRARIVGRRTFGKGLVQEQIEIADGSALRLTVARYYSPSGRCIQKPYQAGKYEDYEEELLQRYMSGEMTGSDTALHGDTTRYYTVKERRLVYGGGGILPDVTVPYKTSPLYVYWNELSRKGLFYQYSFDYADKHRADIKAHYPLAENFVKAFWVSEDMFNRFISYTEEQGIKRDTRSIAAYKEKMKLNIKAYIGRDIYDDEAFYPVYLETDDDYCKGMEILKAL